MANPVIEFFRCPESFRDSELRVQIPEELASSLNAALSHDPLRSRYLKRTLSNADCEELIDMLRRERYERTENKASLTSRLVRNAYYLIRPVLGVAIRRHLQRFFLRGWDTRSFPRWPVDRTADELHELLLIASLKHKNIDRIPFIWFWPDGHSSCAIMTHDVETEDGLNFCPTLMDMDDAAGIKSSFQLVPEGRYPVTAATVATVRGRGFEVNIHDLNHDGHLFRDFEIFRRRADRINAYAEEFGALGFRAGALYRNQDWYEHLKFSYDMSVPNVAHLDPQHGGCCTIFPYFVGDLLELPVTVVQDYSLFHVLGTYSLDFWHTQMSQIVGHHGLINVITHPDYVMEERARKTYTSLLAYMADLRDTEGTWVARPGEVNSWWRQRAKMTLDWCGDRWSVSGAGHERAIVAYAELRDGRLVYRLETDSATDDLQPRTAPT